MIRYRLAILALVVAFTLFVTAWMMAGSQPVLTWASLILFGLGIGILLNTRQYSRLYDRER